jgi:hypothetical protein
LTDTVYQARRLVDRWNSQRPGYEYEVIKTRPYTDELPEDGWLMEGGVSYVFVKEITAMNSIFVARELLSVAKGLTAVMPSNKDGGRIKRALGLILRRSNWDYHIFESRSGSGYEIHAWRDVEQLPDISMVPGARTNDDLAREFEKEEKALSSVLERSLPIPPQEIVVRIRLSRQHDGTKANLYIYLKYAEGHYVTPIEML